jgi:hypothetical protein
MLFQDCQNCVRFTMARTADYCRLLWTEFPEPIFEEWGYHGVKEVVERWNRRAPTGALWRGGLPLKGDPLISTYRQPKLTPKS